MPDSVREWILLVVAVVALLQPWAIATWRRIFRRGVINIYEAGTIEVGYNLWGATIGIQGTLRAVHADQFVRTITLLVTKEKDRSQHRFEWALFTTPRLGVGADAKGVTGELPAGFMLTTSQPHRYSIYFYDASLFSEIQQITANVRALWRERQVELMSESLLPGEEVVEAMDATFQEFSKREEFLKAYTSVDRLCYWEAGRHRLRMDVEAARPDRSFSAEWSFELPGSDSDNLHRNAVTVLMTVCDRGLVGFNSAYARYQSLATR